MSTEIAEIKTIDGSVTLTQFWGGPKNKLSLQITTPLYGKGYFQLTKKQTQKLVQELQEWLGEVELPLYTKQRPSQQQQHVQHYTDFAIVTDL